MPNNKQTNVSVFQYDSKELKEMEGLSPEECLSLTKNKRKVTWVTLEGISESGLIQKFASSFDLHPLVTEDISHTRQRPKVEDYDEYLYIVVRMPFYNNKSDNINTEQISFILGRNYVLTFQEKRIGIFDPVRERLRKGKGRARRSGPDFLTYALLDLVVDHFFVILEKLGEKIGSMEEQVLKDPSPKMLQKIRNLKREMLVLRKSVWPLRELLLSMERESSSKNPLVKKETAVYLRDVYDHTIQVIDTTETFRDMASGMLDIYLSSLSNRMNEIMKVLTVIGTIFIPLTFITGLYGMNFRFMPELEHPLGYPAVLSFMALAIIIMLYDFKRKYWM